MASILKRFTSGLDFWDKEENKRQREQYAAEARQRQPVTDNTPGFQLTNNSLTRGFSRAVDQANPLDNNRTWKQRTPTNTRGVLDITKSGVKQAVKPFYETGDLVRNMGQLGAANITRNQTAANNARQQVLDSFNQSIVKPVAQSAFRLNELGPNSMERRGERQIETLRQKLVSQGVPQEAANNYASQAKNYLYNEKLWLAGYDQNTSATRIYTSAAGDMLTSASLAMAPVAGARIAGVRQGAVEANKQGIVNAVGTGASAYGQTGDVRQAVKSMPIAYVAGAGLTGAGYVARPTTRLVNQSNRISSSKNRRMNSTQAPQHPVTIPETSTQQPTLQGQPQSTRPVQRSSAQPSLPDASRPALQGPLTGQGVGVPQTPLKVVDSSVPKVQLKAPIVNEGKRVIDGADRTTYGLRNSFDASENVPKELKEVLGAFGNERTIKSNKELWQNAQQRVGTDPANAMKFFADNTGDESVATGYALINRYMKAGNTKEAGEIAMTMAERALEAGRTTQAYALMKRLTPEGSVQYVENKVARYIKQNPNKKLNWDEQTRKQLYDLADQINKMPEGRDRNLTIGRMQELVDNIFPSSILDKATTVWKAGLLTSLRTHERNILGNTINAVSEQISTAPGSIADRIMSLRTGKRTLVTSLGEGIGKGALEGGKIAKDQLITGIDVTNSNLKYNINHITWGDNKVEKALKGFTEAVFRPLGAEDKLFKESARYNSLYNQALAEAKTRGLRGKEFDDFVMQRVKNPTSKMLDIADDDAGRATFTHDNFLADIIREAKGSVRRSNKRGANAVSAILDVLMPFTQVPSGVASQLYAYSPAKLAKSIYDVGKVLITGNAEIQRTAAQGFGRSVTGTALLGAGAYLSSKGMMTGQPRDDQERAQWEAQGIKPNSVKVGDRWYQLTSIGPQSLLLLAGAQFELDKRDGEAAYTNIAANLGKNFKDQTFLKGMSSALDAVGDPQRYATAYIQQQVASVVPNILKDVARAIDPNERETRSIPDKLKQSIPGLSNDLPERKDSYGQTIKNSGALELVDLFNSSKQKNISEAQFIDKLRESTGLKEHVPSKVEKSIKINGENKKLNAKEYSDYQSFVGQESKKYIANAQNDPAFMSMSDTDKVKKIDSVLKDINEAAKIKLFGNDSKGASKNAKRILDGQDPSNYSSTISDSINKDYKETLAMYETMDEMERDDFIRTNKDAEYKVALAKYENDKAQGKISRVEDIKRQKELRRYKVGKDFDKDTREFYELSKGDIEDYIYNNDDGKAVAAKLLAYDDALVKAKVISKHKFRDKYGNVDFETTTSSRKKSGSKKLPTELISKAIDVPNIGRAKKANITVRKPSAPNLKKARKAIPKVSKQSVATPKVTRLRA